MTPLRLVDLVIALCEKISAVRGRRVDVRDVSRHSKPLRRILVLIIRFLRPLILE